MSRLPESAARMLRPEHLAVAVDALLARMRRISTAATQPSSAELLRRAARDHVEAGEASLNLLAVLREDGTRPEDVERLERALRGLLDHAAAWFPGEP